MTNRLLFSLAAATLVSTTGRPSAAQTTSGLSAIEGTFRDSLGHPIGGGTLRVQGTSRLVRSNDSGFFHLDSIPPGVRHFVATRLGFVVKDFELDMPPSNTVHVDLRLHRDAGMAAAREEPSDSAARAAPAAIPQTDCRVSTRAGTVAGVVRDESGAVVPFANLSFEARGESPAVADRSGCFVLRGPSEVPLTLIARRIGYREQRQPVTLGDSSAFVEVRMTRAAQAIGGVTVTAQADAALQRTGFYDRLVDRKKGLGDGWYLTPEEIDRRHEDHITSLVQGFPSVVLKAVHVNSMSTCQKGCGGGRTVLVPMGDGGNCLMPVYVDGVRFYLNSKEAGGGSLNALSLGGGARLEAVLSEPTTQGLDDVFDPLSVAAIEIYPHAAQAPARYQMLNGSCGVILIWTKR